MIIIFSAKYNNADSYGMRFNNIRFSNQDLVVPPAVSEGVSIDSINGQEAVNASSYDFSTSLAGFMSQWGAAHDAQKGAVALTGVAGSDLPDGAVANAAVTAKLTVPAAYKYLRLTVSGEEGKSADIRVRMIDLESNTSSLILDWKTVTGTAEQVLQIQSFPTTFGGTLGFVIESRYTDSATAAAVYVKSIEFAAASRNENGYDLEAMSYVPAQAMPADNKFVFDAANTAKWSVFTANDGNTKGYNNNIWLQLESTEPATEYSVLAAYRTTLGSFSTVAVKSMSINEPTPEDTAFMRVRAMKSDGTFVNFTADFTDENGWYDGGYNPGRNDEVIEDYGYGKTIEKTLNVPSELANQEVLLIIEYNRTLSTHWNVLIEHLAFN